MARLYRNGRAQRRRQLALAAPAFQAATLALVSASILSSAARSYTLPRRITLSIFSVAAMSCSGLAVSSTRSAALPVATPP
ncbi:hypothetical protein G6F22_021229 [Rhizopus arrhizus]|nr:hypothetical protein G6F22_021229 [Rhizopus arrhizus]KAG1605451.1 hypothetical protein G6F45_014200 [Rhizopus arrhizus]